MFIIKKKKKSIIILLLGQLKFRKHEHVEVADELGQQVYVPCPGSPSPTHRRDLGFLLEYMAAFLLVARKP